VRGAGGRPSGGCPSQERCCLERSLEGGEFGCAQVVVGEAVRQSLKGQHADVCVASTPLDLRSPHSVSTGVVGNLVFLERSNGDLSAWVLAQEGGTACIVVHDFSTKLRLARSAGRDAVSATRSIAEPGQLWILEYDEMIAKDGDAVVMELLDDQGRMVAAVDHGSRSDVC